MLPILLNNSRGETVEWEQVAFIQAIAHDFDGLRLSLDQFINPAACQEPPSGNDSHTITEHFHVRNNMCAKKHCLSLFPQAHDEIPNFFTSNRIQPRHRLIKNHECRIVDERLSQAHSLQHSL